MSTEIEAELNKAAEAVKASGDRLAALMIIANERKQHEGGEDAKETELRRWCIRVRSLVLVPSTMERAAASLPTSDGSLPAPMSEVLKDAAILGIRELPVVTDVENAFKCIAWCCFAMPLLAKRPSLQEMNSIVAKGEDLKLPEEKPLRMMKSMVQRAKTWQSKVVKALAPRPHVTDPVSVDTLKGLVQAASDIPLSIPGESCVQNVLDDKGTRYCICGGPHFGSFMLGCDRCERWYHGRCVDVKSKEGESLGNWVCPPCKGVQDIGKHLFSVEDFDYTVDEADDEMTDSDDDNTAIHAPSPEKLWPPFGLLTSQEAVDALGEECCAFEDDVDSLDVANFSLLSNGAPSVSNSLYVANGMSLLNSQGMNLSNPYAFGGSLSNDATTMQALFANALTGHSSRLSSVAVLSIARGLGGLATSDFSENGSSHVHGFHGFAVAETSVNGSSDVHSFGEIATSREVHLSTNSNADAENLNSSSSTSHANVSSESLDSAVSPSKNETLCKDDGKHQSPSMNWQPAVLQATSADFGGVARDHSQPVDSSVAQNGAPSHDKETLILESAAAPMVVRDCNTDTSMGVHPSADMKQESAPTSATKGQNHDLMEMHVEDSEQEPTQKISMTAG